MSTTLLITTNGRTGQLRHSLTRLNELTMPDEILIVDDGGGDGCEALVVEFGWMPIRYLYHNNPGQTMCSEARNIGIKEATGDLIITSEPEVMFVTDVIAQMLYLRDIRPTDVISAGTVYHAQSEGVRDPGSCERIQGWVAPFTALYGRDWLLDVGGWDESFPSPWGWDDTDLLTRLVCAGHGQSIVPSIEILHQWHGSSAVDQAANEAHFKAKNLDHDHITHVVANKGREWGIRKT